jgi:hypothetical protein
MAQSAIVVVVIIREYECARSDDAHVIIDRNPSGRARPT